MVTIKDISRKCGVSPATVSKALNGYGDIGAETAELIRRTAQEMHYRPNAAARQLKTNRSNMIGVLFADEQESGLTHDFYARILDSAKKEAESRGFDISFISERIGAEKTSYLEHCRYRNFDGVLISNIDFSDRQVRELIESEIPTVTVDYAYDDQSSIISDSLSGMYELTKYVIEKGHRRIAYIHGEKKLPFTVKRLTGFYKALSESGISVPDEYVIETCYHAPELSAQATEKLMMMPERPTVILYPDDYSYIGGMTQLDKMGFSIPEDISVAGYDGIPLASVLRPALTTYKQDTCTMGRRAIRKLIEAIDNKKTYITEEILVKGELQEGSSVIRQD